jgi:hypothetical protein
MVLGVGHAFESDTDYHLRRRRFQVRNMSAPPTIATKLLRHRLRNAAMPRGFERSSHISLERRDWLAGNVGLELRNVVAKYPFERSHRFPVIQPNSGRRDYSRSSCDGGRRSSGLVPGSRQDACAGRNCRDAEMIRRRHQAASQRAELGMWHSRWSERR